MCGISGVIHFNKIQASHKESVKKITQGMSHRGPDADGFHSNEDICFGHRRLSILDLSDNANQPLLSEDGSVVLVFNGEIYNFQEIRDLLKSKYNFKTDHSDSEVIIYAYREWGIKCVERFNGMFAIAIYDLTIKKVFLVRDRIGQKPLFYHTSDDGAIYFASEINSFFKANLLKKVTNPEAIYDYLTFFATPAPATFFENVYSLKAGHYAEIDSEKIEFKEFWNIASFLNSQTDTSFNEASLKTEELLQQSMIYRNIADVDISIALSGGLDSSLNAFYTSSISPSAHCINIAYSTTSKYDESVIAKQYSEELGLGFTKFVVTKEILLKTIPEYLAIQSDMPMGDPNTVLVYILSKISAEQGSKVLLVGEGGDEIGGYPKYKIANRWNNILNKLPSFSGKVFSLLPPIFTSYFDNMQNGVVIPSSSVFGFTRSKMKRIWKQKDHFDSYSKVASLMDEINVKGKDNYYRKIANVEYKFRLPDLILPRIDYPSMAASVEARSPFLDHKLVEYSATLDFNLKMGESAKALIKNLAKGKLPEYLLKQPKVGFGMLLTPFYKKVLPEWFYQEIILKEAPIKKYIKPSFLKRFLWSHKYLISDGSRLWALYALNQWLVNNEIE